MLNRYLNKVEERLNSAYVYVHIYIFVLPKNVGIVEDVKYRMKI